MARGLESASVESGRIALPKLKDVSDLLDRDGEGAPFDPSYGETLSELLPRRLAELATRH